MARHWSFAAVAIAAIVIVASAATWALHRLDPQSGGQVPTAVARSGDVPVEIYATGEIRAARAALLSAPPSSSTLQIVSMAATGSRVRAGDVVVQFDPAEQQFQLEQSRSELAQAEEELAKLDADTTVKHAQNEIDLMRARFAVRRAELDLKSNDLVGAIQAEKNRLALDEARRRVEQLEAGAKTYVADVAAQRAALEEKRNKERLDLAAMKMNIDRMTLRAPFDGIVVAQENRDAAGGIFFGMPMPEYRDGDVVQPGRPVAEVFDGASVEVVARIAESEGSNVAVGQPAQIRFYPAAARSFDAAVTTVGGPGARRFWESSSRQLEVVLRMKGDLSPLQPGWTGDVVIRGEPLRGVVYVPRQAIVEKDGRSVVYVRRSGTFAAVPIRIRRRTEALAAIEGVQAGSEVALRNPEQRPTVPSGAAPVAAGVVR